MKMDIFKERTHKSFNFNNGYEFEAVDCGLSDGVKFTLSNHDEHGAVMLPPNTAVKFSEWMRNVLSQPIRRLPVGLRQTLQGILSQKGQDITLGIGDKAKFKAAVKMLEKI